MSTHSNSTSRPKPTLEELLRMKRAERPDAAFWQAFERGMQQKQLAAIVEPRPWWLGVFLLGRRVMPVGFPVSAAAAAMLALAALRVSPFGGLVHTPAHSSPEPTSVSVPVADMQVVEMGAGSAPVSSAPEELDRVSALVFSGTPMDGRSDSVGAQADSAGAALDAKSHLAMTNEVSGMRPAALAFAEDNMGSLADTVGGASAPQVVDEAASVQGGMELSEATFSTDSAALNSDHPGLDSRHARLLSGAGEFDDGRLLAKARDRVLQRLADDEAKYAAVGRVGVNADRLSLKF